MVQVDQVPMPILQEELELRVVEKEISVSTSCHPKVAGTELRARIPIP